MDDAFFRVMFAIAHCFFDDYGYPLVDKAYAAIGHNDIRKAKWYRIEQVVAPSDYMPAIDNSLYGDLVVAKLEKATREKPIRLANWKTKIPAWYIVAGWGSTEMSDYTNKLRYVAVPSLSSREVNSWFADNGYADNFMEEDHFAAGLEPNGADSCVGDSGGPIFKPGKKYTNSETKKDTAMGIVSWGPSENCGSRGANIGFYTSIPYWRYWIEDVIELNNWIGKSTPSRKCNVLFDECITGKNVRKTKTSSPGICCSKCRKKSSCKAWRWTDDRVCLLKKKGYKSKYGQCVSGTMS